MYQRRVGFECFCYPCNSFRSNLIICGLDKDLPAIIGNSIAAAMILIDCISDVKTIGSISILFKESKEQVDQALKGVFNNLWSFAQSCQTQVYKYVRYISSSTILEVKADLALLWELRAKLNESDFKLGGMEVIDAW